MLKRKVDKQDFNTFMNSKTSKKDTQKLLDQISVIHKQLESLALLYQQLMKIKVDGDNPETRALKPTKYAQIFQ